MAKNNVHRMSAPQAEITSTAIVPYDTAFARDVALIANKSFGEGYMNEDRLKEVTGGQGSFYSSVTDGKISGYCFFQYITADLCASKIKLPKETFVQNSSSDGMVCYTKTMAVDESLRGRGVADDLFEACLNKAVSDGLFSAWGSAWRLGNIVPMNRIFLKNGFCVHSEVPYIWYDDKQYKCIVCGGRCKCTGVIYRKLLLS
ncbi:MAG: N-acetyltransferase [Oscillospiraceae bacterium]|nr:N-acetyltransferase [Oscillospiraceae bacterium]